jgi:hypothetical protein
MTLHHSTVIFLCIISGGSIERQDACRNFRRKHKSGHKGVDGLNDLHVIKSLTNFSRPLFFSPYFPM